MIHLKKNQVLESIPFNDFVNVLRSRLRRPLPGLDMQLRMTSNARIRELMDFGSPENAVPSSVLLLLYPADGDIFTVFMQRPEYDGVHSGQISLPGGKSEVGDSDPAATALREAREEIGIDPARVELIGKLTDLYIPPSNFMVSPFVGFTDGRPEFVTDPVEVSRIVEVRVKELMDPSNIKQVTIRVRKDFELTAPAYTPGGEVIWGATAMMVSEFCAVARDAVKEFRR